MFRSPNGNMSRGAEADSKLEGGDRSPLRRAPPVQRHGFSSLPVPSQDPVVDPGASRDRGLLRPVHPRARVDEFHAVGRVSFARPDRKSVV